MKVTKILACVLAGAIALTPVFAQSRTETTAEEDYMSSFEDLIISELTVSEEYDNKTLALDYIEEALAKASSSRDLSTIQASLESLAGEGVLSESRTSGRVSNNYPDVRARACELLGRLDTYESKDTLEKVALADNEPMVASAAIRSLGNVSSTDPDGAIATIIWVENKYSILNPTGSLAWDVLVTYEKLAPKLADKTDMIRSITKIASDYHYPTVVRDKAKALLKQYTGRR